MRKNQSHDRLNCAPGHLIPEVALIGRPLFESPANWCEKIGAITKLFVHILISALEILV